MLGNGNGTFGASTPVNLGRDAGGRGGRRLQRRREARPGGGLERLLPRLQRLLGLLPGLLHRPGAMCCWATAPARSGPRAPRSISSANSVSSVAVADFNGDGKLDVATADTGYFYGGGHTVVAFGDGAGALGTPVARLPDQRGFSPVGQRGRRQRRRQGRRGHRQHRREAWA